MPEKTPSQDINVTIHDNAEVKAAAIGNENLIASDVGQVDGNFIQALNSDVHIGNKTVINNIIQQAAKQIVTAPYKFLASYNIGDRDIFFGRDAVIDDLAGKIPRHKALIINGRSGAGKTSLINAGLLPRLADNGYTYLSFREYSDPVRQLQRLLAQDEHLSPHAGEVASFSDVLHLLTRQQTQKMVFVFDQFERFFVNVPAQQRTQLVSEFRAFINSSLSAEQMNIVFSLREDFFGAFVIEFEQFMPHFLNESAHYNLHPLKPDEAREAIVRPLQNIPVHIGYNPRFVDEVLLPGLIGESSGGQQIDPPHLQIVCNQLYQAVRERYADDLKQGGVAQIDRDLYTSLGETSGILRSYLDDFIDRTAHRDSGGRDMLRSMLKLMLETTGTRKFVSVGDLKTGLPDVSPDKIEQHLRECQDGRIIETRGQGEAARYSLSHDVMVAKVRSWFDERELERKKAQETLERGLAEWHSTQSLLSEKQVQHIRTWLGQDTLNDDTETLLTASQDAYESRQRKEAEQERRIRRNRKAFQLALAIGFVVAVILSGIAFWQRNEAVKEQQRAEEQTVIAEQQRATAEDRRQEAERRSMVSLAQAMSFQAIDQLAQYNGPRAALLARQAYLLHQQHQGNKLAQMDRSLRQVLEGIPFENRMFKHPDRIDSVIFTPDSKFLASNSGGKVRLWDLTQPTTTPRIIAEREWEGSSAVFRPDVFSPDGTYLAFSSPNKAVRVWDLTQPNVEPRIFTGHSAYVYSVAFSPDGARLASGSEDKTVRVWDLTQSATTSRVLTGHEERVSSVAFSPDGTYLASGSRDKTVRLWDLTQPQPDVEPRILTGHSDGVNSVAFSPDGKFLASGSWDKTVRLWDLTQPDVKSRILTGHGDYVKSVAFSPDGKFLASGSWDKTVRLWDLTQPDAMPIIIVGYEEWVFSVMFSPDGKFLASVSDDQIVRVWDLTQPASAVPRVLTGHEEGVSSVAFSPDGARLASGNVDKTVRVWDMTHPDTPPRVLTGHESKASSVAFSPDGKFLASGSRDKTVRLWDLTQPDAMPIVIVGHESGESSVAFSPDGTHLAYCDNETVRLWDMTQPDIVPRILLGGTRGLRSVAFSPDGTRLAAGSFFYGTVWLWDVSTILNMGITAAVPHVLTSPRGGISSLAFSPDGTHLASGSMDEVLLWDITQPATSPLILTGHGGIVWSVAFSPDGTHLASGSSDRTVRVWDLTSPVTSPLIMSGHSGWVNSVAFSPDGTHIASGSSDKTVRIWNIRTEELAEQICEQVGRNLSWEEWQQFVSLDIPYGRTCPDLPILPNLLKTAQNLASTNNLDAAQAIFQLALNLDSTLTLDPATEANKWRAQGLVEEGQYLAKQGNSQAALAAYADAGKLDPNVEISADDWNQLCWQGSLHGAAAEVLDACEQAVQLAPNEGWIRDSRGLARALTGNIAGAIEDFQAFVNDPDDEESKAQRQEWIEALQAGENPFTTELLEELRSR